MRKILLSVLLAVTLVLFLSSISLAVNPNWNRKAFPESKFGAPSDTTKTARDNILRELLFDPDGPATSIIPRNASGREISEETTLEYGFPIYGGPLSIPKGTKPNGFALATQDIDSNGEWRYLGYSIFGDPITNMWFEPDGPWSKQHTTPYNPPIDDWDNNSGAAVTDTGLNLRNWVEIVPDENGNPPTTWNIWHEWDWGYKIIAGTNPETTNYFNKIYGELKIYTLGSGYTAGLASVPDQDGNKVFGFNDAYKKMMEVYGTPSSPPWENFRNGKSATHWFAVVSPYSPVTPLQVIGKFGGGNYYRTYVVYPDLQDIKVPSLPDLGIEITYPTDTNKPTLPAGTGPFTFQSTIKVTLLDDSGYPTDKQPMVIYRYIVDGTPKPWVEDVFTKTSKDQYQDYTLDFQMDHGDNIVIQAVVNPVFDPVGNLMMDGNGNPAVDYDMGYRLIEKESDFKNNYAYFSSADDGTPAASQNKYLYIGVYPATEKLKRFTDKVEVEASFRPHSFTDVSWDTPSNTKWGSGIPSGKPTVVVKPNAANNLSYVSGSSYSLVSNGNPLDPTTYADIINAIFPGDKDQTQGLSCQTDSSNVSSLGTEPDHDHGPGSGEGGCENIGDAY